MALLSLLSSASPQLRTTSTNLVSMATAVVPSPTKPATPAAPIVTPAATSVSVLWTAPQTGGLPITRYSLRYRQTGGDWVFAPDAAASARSASITGLTANRTYEVAVRASNSLGNSAWSLSGLAKTTNVDSNVLWQDGFDKAADGRLTKATGDALFGPTAAATGASTYQNGSILSDPEGGKFLRDDIAAGGLGDLIVSPKLARPSEHAILSYDVRFDDNFDWRWGGKLPGLVGVAPGHGIYEPTSGNVDRSVGFSTRLMWHGRGDDGSRPFQSKLGPIPQGSDNVPVTYIYAPSPSDGFGGYGWQTNLGAGFERGQWQHVVMEVKLNTVGASDGVFGVWIDGTLRYQATNVVYRVRNDVKIQAVLYDIHRGGEATDPSWVSTRKTSVDIRNMTVVEG